MAILGIKQTAIVTVFFLLSFCNLYAQEKSLFKQYTIQGAPENRFGEIMIAKDGSKYISASELFFADIMYSGFRTFGGDFMGCNHAIKKSKEEHTKDPIRFMTESSDGNIFYVTPESQITYFNKIAGSIGICDIPPFYFPIKGDSPKKITKIWFDGDDNLYIGVTGEAFYIVPLAGTDRSLDTSRYKIGSTNDSNMVILKGELRVKKIIIDQGNAVYSFAEAISEKNIIWLGTGNGLYNYNKITGEVNKVLMSLGTITITHIEILRNGDIWFSTLEKGMGVYHQLTKTNEFFSYLKKNPGLSTLYPIANFCVKSSDDFFVAIKDSVPAIFNFRSKTYKFINDSSFVLSANSTTDIKLDKTNNFYLIKGGLLYSAHLSDNPEWFGPLTRGMIYTPSVTYIDDYSNKALASYENNPELLKNIELKYYQNSITIYFTSNYYSSNKLTRFAWILDGVSKDWVEIPVLDSTYGSNSKVRLEDLKPGKYIFRVRVKIEDSEWSKNEAKLEIIVTAPIWQTWWFWASIITGLGIIIGIIMWWWTGIVKKRESEKFAYEKQIIELEAKALRSQMNPHFIFNCLNSIKSLIQQHEEEKSVNYLTTFSKLIRTLFNNADKKEISLFDEIETCKLYLQLEAMRFDTKFSYSVKVDDNLDLKSVLVPALIIQPFIENAIWHGIVPKGEAGHVELLVVKKANLVEINVDDNGIGREASKQNKSASALMHNSKGINLTQSRLELDNLLRHRNAKLEIVDKIGDDGSAVGTKVIITINEETS